MVSELGSESVLCQETHLRKVTTLILCQLEQNVVKQTFLSINVIVSTYTELKDSREQD